MDKYRTSGVLIVLLAAVAVIGMVSETATAVDTYWQAAAPADWSSANWNNGEPGNLDRGFLDNGGTINITQTGETFYRFYIEGGGGGGGTVNMTGGDVNISNAYGANCKIAIGSGGGGVLGTWNHSGGTLTGNSSNAQLQVGAWCGGPTGGDGYFYHTGGTVDVSVLFVACYATGVYELTGSSAQLTTEASSVGYGYSTQGTGIGNFLQTNGTHTTGRLCVGGGWNDGGTGTYNMQGGSLTVNGWLDLGWVDTTSAGNFPCVGTFNQSGGTVTIQDAVAIGYGYNNADSTGTYNFTGGTLTDDANNADLYVRYDGGTGTFQGRGTVDLSGTLQNNGRVIADGGTLNMSSFGSVTNTMDNTMTNGWFAMDGGKLELPSVPVSGDGSYNWGEDPSDTQIDLVNSARVTFAGVSGSGDLDIDLLDPANAAAPNTTTFEEVVGLWEVANTGFAFGSADLTFRYDDASTANESKLQLFQHEGGSWVEVPSTLDMVNNLISATGLTSFSAFVVGAIPEPSTVALALLGLLTLGLYGRRRRRV